MAAALLKGWKAGAYRRGDHGDVLEDPRKLATLYREGDFGPVDIDALLHDLADGLPEVQTQALVLVRTRLYPDAVPGLIRLLTDGSYQGRLYAAELLGDIGDRAAIGPLERMAELDPDLTMRGMAVRSLKMLEALPDR
ncbi:MAG TPA: HEAT repeat domain-containing protein [Candidatus Dormibacteraeota bacterium]|nr:HEAT repeat domain-containing protein [Candidatus Dormibacteraeota bacterium]